MIPSSTSSHSSLALGDPPAVYVPKPVVLVLLVAVFGLVGAWAFHEATADAATATVPATAPNLPSTPGPSALPAPVPGAPASSRLAPSPVAAPPAAEPSAGGPVRVTVVPGSTTHLVVDPTTGVVSGDSATARSTTHVVVDPSTGAVSGESSTARTTTHIEKTPDGRVDGVSQARTTAPVALPPPATSPSPATAAAPPSPPAASTVPAPGAPSPAAAGSTASTGPGVGTTAGAPLTVTNSGAPSAGAAGDGLSLQIPPFFGEDLFRPLPGTKTRGIAFSEWESYRTDVAGRNIVVTTDDSNFFRDRNGKLNGNTGDTDASGLNVTGATDSVILGTESADEAPYQTVGQGVVDIASGKPSAPEENSGEDDDEDDDSAESQASQSTGGNAGEDGAPDTDTGDAESSVARAAFIPMAAADDEGFDFPYTAWMNQVGGSAATAIHTDEGTTLASGQEAFVIGGDGYDDDDNRVTGENIVVTRDDGNVVLGGTGDVNAQIGDSEQGAVIMDVTRTYIQGGGAY
jgi:hypothetical protein